MINWYHPGSQKLAGQVYRINLYQYGCLDDTTTSSTSGHIFPCICLPNPPAPLIALDLPNRISVTSSYCQSTGNPVLRLRHCTSFDADNKFTCTDSPNYNGTKLLAITHTLLFVAEWKNNNNKKFSTNMGDPACREWSFMSFRMNRSDRMVLLIRPFLSFNTKSKTQNLSVLFRWTWAIFQSRLFGQHSLLCPRLLHNGHHFRFFMFFSSSSAIRAFSFAFPALRIFSSHNSLLLKIKFAGLLLPSVVRNRWQVVLINFGWLSPFPSVIAGQHHRLAGRQTGLELSLLL